jgi:CheY-like chemotaxis protein
MATILLVDDEEMNRDMLCRRHEHRGDAVAHAADGQRALTILELQKCDVILCDRMMPGVSGLVVFQSLRQRYSMPDLPVIMATAKDRNSDIVEALKLGAKDSVTKPFHHLLWLGPQGQAHRGWRVASRPSCRRRVWPKRWSLPRCSP